MREIEITISFQVNDDVAADQIAGLCTACLVQVDEPDHETMGVRPFFPTNVKVDFGASPPFLTPVRITRRYAEWKEDAIIAGLPLDIDATDDAAVNEWAMENYDRLYVDAKNRQEGKTAETDAEIAVEDKFVHDLDFPESEIDAELL